MRRFWPLHLNVQLSRRSKSCIRETVFPEFRHRQNSGFVQAGGRHADGMLDAFRVGERDNAGTVRHLSSIGEEKENIGFRLTVSDDLLRAECLFDISQIGLSSHFLN